MLIRILDTVTEIRKMDSGIGSYKLWLMMRSMFGEDWLPGRDAFIGYLRELGLTLPAPKPRRTTNSNHRFRKYKNLIKGFIPTAANQLWVSDITYINTIDGNCYLHLVTDVYSRMIVGWYLSDNLGAENTLRALQMAIGQASADSLLGLIHHSDRGVQYCCNTYVDELNKYGIRISMTEDYKPTDNAIAERVNGTIKVEVVYRERRFKDYDDALQRLSRFISFYNEQRPHSSINYQTPLQAHSQTGLQKRRW